MEVPDGERVAPESDRDAVNVGVLVSGGVIVSVTVGELDSDSLGVG